MKTLKTTRLSNSEVLPLTCSRSGMCCHGNQVWINPWEINQLANSKNITPKAFCDTYTDFGGIRLKFEGKANTTGKKSCLLYDDQQGCSVHNGRPLACRMYPLGRQIQSGETHYIFQGEEFPCFKECPEVKNLPHLSVKEYLSGQQSFNYELAQTYYLEIVQNLAENAFALLLDTPLATSGDRQTLTNWRNLGNLDPNNLYQSLDKNWIEDLNYPPIESSSDPFEFTTIHNEYLQQKIQNTFETYSTLEELQEGSSKLMAMALYLALGIGADIREFTAHWIEIAKSNGALE